jgi:hypothetical protein
MPKTPQVVQVTVVAREVTRCNLRNARLRSKARAFVFMILSHSTVHYINKVPPIESKHSLSMPAMKRLDLVADEHVLARRRNVLVSPQIAYLDRSLLRAWHTITSQKVAILIPASFRSHCVTM